MRPYSKDLRERVAAAVDHGEGSQREIARRFRGRPLVRRPPAPKAPRGQHARPQAARRWPSPGLGGPTTGSASKN